MDFHANSPLRRWSRQASWLALALGLALGSRAQTIVYQNFNTTTGLSLNDTIVSNGALLLASSNRDKRGSAFTTSQFNVAGFSTVFEFRISSPGGSSDGISAGADGVTFTLQREGSTALGSLGSGLGYSGISNSVAIEFDTFSNSFDPNSNHVGVNLNGSTTSAATATVATAFDGGQKWTVWVDYNGSTLEVRASTDGNRPTSVLLSHSINLTTTIGGSSAYLGFTGSTGQAYGTHEILGWAYSDTFLANGIAAVPEPGTYALLGLGGLLLLGARRFRRAR